MLSEATRPPWLYNQRRLGEFLEKQNLTLNIVQLRCDRNRCKLVDNILDQIALKEYPNPSEFEKGLARNHLAVDLQSILQQWCGIGLQETMKGSALLSGVPTPPSNRQAPRLSMGGVITTTKIEAPSPEAVMFSPHTTFSNYRIEGGDSCQPRQRDILPSAQQQTLSSRPVKRQLDDPEQYEDAIKVPRIDRTSSFICPYYARNENSPDHADCANKTFPNPRKLKEHVWRWLKPFKCPNCGEGFGREKTRAIHCEQRKTKCKKAISTYEQSPERRRDNRIELAKSTQEMMTIFEDYEKEINELNQNASNQEESMSAESESSSSSPEPHNDAQNASMYNAPESEMDCSRDEPQYRTTVRMDVLEHRPAMQDVRPRLESLHQTHDLREGSDSTFEGLTPQNCSNGAAQGQQLSPGWQQGGGQSQFNSPNDRRRSEPSLHYPSMASNNFPQAPSMEPMGVPKITVTQHEPALDFLISVEPAMYSISQEIRDTPYLTDPMDEGPQNGFPDISQELSERRNTQQTVPFRSGGYGSFQPFDARLRFK